MSMITQLLPPLFVRMTRPSYPPPILCLSWLGHLGPYLQTSWLGRLPNIVRISGFSHTCGLLQYSHFYRRAGLHLAHRYRQYLDLNVPGKQQSGLLIQMARRSNLLQLSSRDLSSKPTQLRQNPSPSRLKQRPKLRSRKRNGEIECQNQRLWMTHLPNLKRPMLCGRRCFLRQRLTYLGPAKVEIIFGKLPSLSFHGFNLTSPSAPLIRKYRLWRLLLILR